MFSFEWPLALVLLPAPLLIWFYHQYHNKPGRLQQTSIYHSRMELITTLSPQTHNRIPWVWLIAVMLIIVALARPLWSDLNNPDNYQSHTIMLMLDTSESMRAIDYTSHQGSIDRLTLVKRQAQQFINQRNGDQVGLVAFANLPVIYSPLSYDLTTIEKFIDEIEPGITGEKTALGDAITSTVAQFNSRTDSSKILIVFSDGNNNYGEHSVESAIITAKNAGIRIYTIGIGHDGPVPFPRGPVLKPVMAQFPMNLALLRDIASRTGGLYFYIDESQQLQEALNTISVNEPVQLNPDSRELQDFFWLPLLTSLLLILIDETSRKRQVLPG